MFFISRIALVINVIFFSLFAVIVSLPACKQVQRNKSHPEITDAQILKGKSLVEMYCKSCHAFPEPKWLDSKTWATGVLPAMGPRLGIFQYGFEQYPSSRFDKNLDSNFYPAHPVIKLSQWQSIIDYYIASAPDTLLYTRGELDAITGSLPTFEVLAPLKRPSSPATTFVKFLNKNGKKSLVFCDAMSQVVIRTDTLFKVVDSVNSKGPIVDIDFSSERWTACNIGVLNPNNGRFGSGQSIAMNVTNKMQIDSSFLFDKLARPVQLTSTDINVDGKTDYLVCEFGYQTGMLSWMENLGSSKYIKHILKPLPGAIKAYMEDVNKDGLPDIWALFAQGEEGIFLFTNKGNGSFSEKEVLHFPPVYGSSYFEMVDYNKDGHKDIIYTCGDNADYSAILKPYHGLYIFINDRKNNFQQKYFFHINGCFKAIPRDFDNDGDIDIAAISFFADYTHRPEEGFVYLENKGRFDFIAHSSIETQKGRWLTMDAGDMDGDGLLDLVLGNFSIGPAMFKPKFDWKKGPPFLVLKNTGKH